MAEQGVSGVSSKPEQEPIKKKRTFPRRIADRSRKSQSSRRACTPEPGLKAWTDESEKDVSDAENVAKSREVARRRTRSAERTKIDDPETDEDFEIIRNLHKRKELEEETKPAVVEKVKPKEEVKPPKELPPLIVAPPDLKKRARHKSQLIAELSRKTVTTSEEEDEKQVSKQRKSPEARKLRRVAKKEKTEELEVKPNESPQVEEIMKEESVPVKEPKKWFWWGGQKKEEVEEEKEPKKRSWWGRQKEKEVEEEKEPKKRSWWGRRKEKEVEEEKEVETEKPEKRQWLLFRVVHEWRLHVQIHGVEYNKIKSLKNKCISQLLLVMMFCGFGGMIFRFVEGAFESFYKCGVKRVKRDFIDTLWSYSQYMLEEDWKSQARRRLMDFENQLHAAHEAGMTTYSGQKSWSFLNSVVYCLTVITTIGYGHISPSTTTGRAITIIYAIFGIPMFLILLADFGKLFTRGIKFLWAFVRRLYYTGSCKKVRRTAPVQEVMKGMQFMYDFAKNRRPSQWGPEEHHQRQQQNQLPVPEANIGVMPETPGTPNMSAFEIDDEFNLPISVAITILLIYIFVGATIYWMWEEWSFFESFYFVFISMSTIGFGDFVPQNPVYMMASIIYLVFGLALTSMCINVVQEKLSDTFRQASTKIGATIGLRVAEDGSITAPPELADMNPLQNLQTYNER